MNSISKEMLQWRIDHILTQSDCAKKAGISLQTWNQIECGRQEPSKLTEKKIRMIIEGDSKCEEVSAD